MHVRAPRLMIAGTSSGAGKTTVACGLLRVFERRGLRLQACKCGPDYIDPLFHAQVLGVPSRNLDLFLGDGRLACALLARGAQCCDLTLIEGVMGYYDGIAHGDEASSFDVARVTRTPAVLVVDARGKALSVAAEVLGFARLRQPSFLAGIVLNRASAATYPLLKAVVERETGLLVLGHVPTLDVVELKSRHLGLVMPAEVSDLQAKIDALADTLEHTLDVDALLGLAGAAADLEVDSAGWEQVPTPAPEERPRPTRREGGVPRAVPQERGLSEHGTPPPLRRKGVAVLQGRAHADPFARGGANECGEGPIIAVARDEAFCFYYHDTFALLERLSARLAFFSPLEDERVPVGASGLYLGGGYPELHARALSQNRELVDQVRELVAGGLPTIAECGGFLYLHQSLEDAQGIAWPMAGVVSGHATRGSRLGPFGYATLAAREDGLLARTGETLAAHEFHYWQSDCAGTSFVARKPHSDRTWDCVIGSPTLYAGFPHLYLPGCPQAAWRFVRACADYAAARSDRRS